MSIPADLQWQLVRKSNCYLHKQRGVNKLFSKDPLNMKNVHSQRYCGLVAEQAVGIIPSENGKGVTFVCKTKKNKNKPATARRKIALNKNGRKTLKTIRNMMVGGHYRPELVMLAQRRASQLIRSQKPVSSKRAGLRATSGKKTAKTAAD